MPMKKGHIGQAVFFEKLNATVGKPVKVLGVVSNAGGVAVTPANLHFKAAKGIPVAH
nr:hypothetical protein [Desulfofundulus luciae]